MKTQPHRTAERRRRPFEADLEASIDEIFRRWPNLCGFAIREVARPVLDPDEQVSELMLTEVSVYPMHSLTPPEDLCHEIVSSLATMLDERPEMSDLLAGRSFARTFH